LDATRLAELAAEIEQASGLLDELQRAFEPIQAELTR